MHILNKYLNNFRMISRRSDGMNLSAVKNETDIRINENYASSDGSGVWAKHAAAHIHKTYVVVDLLKFQVNHYSSPITNWSRLRRREAWVVKD